MPLIKPPAIAITPVDEVMLRQYARFIGADPNAILADRLDTLRKDKDFAAWRVDQGLAVRTSKGQKTAPLELADTPPFTRTAQG